ncbi:MAG: hypothetical protein WD269_05555 [Acidimicrobiia bacterium]
MALMVFGCGSVGGEPTGLLSPPVATTAQSGAGPSGEVIIIPADGELPPDLMVGCFSGPSFPMAVLDRIVPLSDGDPGGVTEAITSFLLSEEGLFWPQDDWQILNQTESEITLVHEGPGGEISFIFVSHEDDQWRWSGASSGGACPLEYVISSGMNAVDWRLDPSSPAPTAESTEIAVLITERECVGGQEIGDRLVGPQIIMTESVVRLAFAAQPPDGTAFDCQGNPETPLSVVLPEPIGDRELVEGMDIGIELGDYLD